MNLRANTNPMLEALRRCTSLPTRARVVPAEESLALAQKVAAQAKWLQQRQFWKRHGR